MDSIPPVAIILGLFMIGFMTGIVYRYLIRNACVIHDISDDVAAPIDDTFTFDEKCYSYGSISDDFSAAH